MKKIILIFLSFAVSINAQEFRRTATAGFTFLELPVSARSAALGEASIALSDLNAQSIFINPASLGFTDFTHSFSTSYSPWIAEIKHYTTSYAYSSPLGVFGIGLIYLDYGEMPRTQKIEGQKVYEILGSFSANDIAIALSYSRKLTDKFSFGVSAKYVREKIDIYKADNFLFDGGMLYYTGLGSLRVAATLQNFGVETQFRYDQFRMPVIFKLGLATEVIGSFNSNYRVTTIIEASHPTDADERLNFGLEVNWNQMLTLRGGYKFFYDEETYSFGIGLNPKLTVPIDVDISLSNYGRLGNILRFSLLLGLL